MTDTAPTDTKRRMRRTVFLLAAVVLVAIGTPVVAITSFAPDFLAMGARLVAPWGSSSAGMPTASTTVVPVTSLDDAGDALRRILRDRNTSDNIPMRTADGVALPERDSLAAGLFPEARDSSRGGLEWTKALIVARRRLSPAERAYLAGIAANPFWEQWDRLARAPSVDIVGSRVELPFGEHATMVEMPLMKLMTFNNAGRLTAARAAHFIAIGRRDSAEAAVHATLAVGLLIDREATNVIEAYVGRRLVSMATTLSNGLRGDTMTAPDFRLPRDSTARTEAEGRAVLVAVASDSTAHRAARFEALMNLGMVPCTNVRELLFGFRRDVQGAFDSARRNLIRHPSDSALLDLIEYASERSPDVHQSGFAAATFRVMSHISSTLLFNKRIHGCGEMIPYMQMMM